MTYYVETLRPCYPTGGITYVVHSEKGFCRDVLSPDMTAVFRVSHVASKKEAVALVLEKAAGFGCTVELVFGGERKATK